MTSTYVLVVDDDEEMKTVVMEVLEDAGYRAVGADNGLEALKLITELSEVSLPSMILLDIHMPVMSGWELLATLLKMRPDIAKIPIFLTTADALPHNVAYTHLQKPFTIEQVMVLARKHATPLPVSR
jgi:CheY-like chemotaxis protein